MRQNEMDPQKNNGCGPRKGGSEGEVLYGTTWDSHIISILGFSQVPTGPNFLHKDAQKVCQ